MTFSTSTTWRIRRSGRRAVATASPPTASSMPTPEHSHDFSRKENRERTESDRGHDEDRSATATDGRRSFGTARGDRLATIATTGAAGFEPNWNANATASARGGQVLSAGRSRTRSLDEPNAKAIQAARRGRGPTWTSGVRADEDDLKGCRSRILPAGEAVQRREGSVMLWGPGERGDDQRQPRICPRGAAARQEEQWRDRSRCGHACGQEFTTPRTILPCAGEVLESARSRSRLACVSLAPRRSNKRMVARNRRKQMAERRRSGVLSSAPRCGRQRRTAYAATHAGPRGATVCVRTQVSRERTARRARRLRFRGGRGRSASGRDHLQLVRES